MFSTISWTIPTYQSDYGLHCIMTLWLDWILNASRWLCVIVHTVFVGWHQLESCKKHACALCLFHRIPFFSWWLTNSWSLILKKISSIFVRFQIKTSVTFRFLSASLQNSAAVFQFLNGFIEKKYIKQWKGSIVVFKDQIVSHTVIAPRRYCTQTGSVFPSEISFRERMYHSLPAMQLVDLLHFHHILLQGWVLIKIIQHVTTQSLEGNVSFYFPHIKFTAHPFPCASYTSYLNEEFDVLIFSQEVFAEKHPLWHKVQHFLFPLQSLLPVLFTSVSLGAIGGIQLRLQHRMGGTVSRDTVEYIC